MLKLWKVLSFVVHFHCSRLAARGSWLVARGSSVAIIGDKIRNEMFGNEPAVGQLMAAIYRTQEKK